jgi:hypothetical protein
MRKTQEKPMPNGFEVVEILETLFQ